MPICKGVVTTPVLNVRALPGESPDNPPVDLLAGDTHVDIYEWKEVDSTVWFRTGEERWVHGGWVRLTEDVPPDELAMVSPARALEQALGQRLEVAPEPAPDLSEREPAEAWPSASLQLGGAWSELKSDAAAGYGERPDERPAYEPPEYQVPEYQGQGSAEVEEVSEGFGEDPTYAEALRYLQAGTWVEALAALEELSQRYPESREVETLLEQTRQKSSLDQDWGNRIKVRRSPISWKRVLSRAATGLVLAGVVFMGITLYQQWYLPTRALRAVRAEELQLQELGDEALASGDYEMAQEVFRQALEVSPEDPVSLAGLEEAERQVQLGSDYEAALAALAAGDLGEARAGFLDLQDRAPGYRDVVRRLSELENMERPGQLFAEAEEHYRAEQWPEAIQAYEELRELSETYEAETVEQRLFECALARGKALVSVPSEDGLVMDEAQDMFRLALSLKPRSPRPSWSRSSPMSTRKGWSTMRRDSGSRPVCS